MHMIAGAATGPYLQGRFWGLCLVISWRVQDLSNSGNGIENHRLPLWAGCTVRNSPPFVQQPARDAISEFSKEVAPFHPACGAATLQGFTTGL